MKGIESTQSVNTLPAFDVGMAASTRIAQINGAVLNTGLNLLPAIAGIGALALGFRYMYDKVLGRK